MKTSFKRLTALLLALVLTLSLLSAAAIAVDVPDYAHLRIGAVSGQPGDTVKVPVYLEGLQDGQKCRGFDASITLGENLTLEGAEWTDLVSGFGYKIFNKVSGYLNAADIMGTGFRITADGKVCDLLVKIADDATSVGAVSLTNVSISGEKATDFLNSTDGTMTGRDQDAVVIPTDESGASVPIISITQTASFTMKVEADSSSVTAGEDVTVTVKVEGGDFVGAAAKLSYDSSKFKIKTADASTGWSETSNGYAYYNVAAGQNATLGTFVFTALAQTEEVTGSFTLSDTYCEETWDSGASVDVATPCANNGKVDVTIALKEDLEVTAENKTVTYDGNAQAFNNVTCSVEGATIVYGETEGNYDLSTVPADKVNADTYTLYYQVTALGYAPKTGSYTLTIEPADIEYTADGYTGAYDGNPHTISVTVTKPTDADITYSETEDGTYTAIAPTLTEVGNKTVWFKINAANYDETKASKTIAITEAEITFEISANTTVTFDGDSHVSATVTSKLPEDATVAYTCNGQTYNVIPSFTDASTYEVSYTVTHDNYTAKTGTYTFIIGKANIDSSSYSITANPDVNYDGEAHESATVTLPEGAAISYTCNEVTYNTVPSFTNVGTYNVSYTITAGDNYTDVTGTYTFTIKEGTLTLTGADYNGVYDGKAHTITVTAPEDTVITYSETENGEYSETAPTLTDAGTKTVYWKVEKFGYATETGSNTIAITKKAVTITIDAKSKSIGDTDPEFTATVNDLVKEDDLGTITYTRNPGETAGKYEISASYTENTNYDVTVVKEHLTITIPTFEVETVADYVTGYSLVLVYTDGNATFTYDDAAMYDVTSAGYKYGTEESESSYDHVYALVVEGEADQTKIAAGITPVADTLNCDDLDVNKSGSVDLRDAVAVVAVYNANETYMTKYMSIVLEADVNHDKQVNATDFGEIKAEYLK